MQHMLAHAREAVELVRGRRSADLEANRMLQLALLQLIRIVGEAARRVSPQAQARYPEIPWREAITTRNRVTHGYDTIDSVLIWNTITEDFPPLVEALQRVLDRAGE